MNLEGADRILNAVGREFYPPDLDRLEMIRGIELCGDWYRQAAHYGTKKNELRRERTLALISKAAKRLEHLLIEDDAQKLYAGDSITARLSKDGYDAMRTLRQLFNEAERNIKLRIKKNGPTAAYQQGFRKWSPFEWIVGRWLPLVYMELKMHDPGSIEALVAKDSPYVRFVMASLIELKITKSSKPYSRVSVIKAVRLPFSGKVRRKAASQEDGYHRWREKLLLRAMKPHLFANND